MVRDWPLKWHLGELCVGTFPLTRLRLLGGSLAFPENESACDLLFSKVLSDGGFDAVVYGRDSSGFFLLELPAYEQADSRLVS